MTTYKRHENAVSIGDSFTDNWQYESDTLKRIKDKLGDDYPKSNRRDVVRDGHFKSGMERWSWYLVDTSNKEDEKVIDIRYAMRMESKKTNKPYFMISSFPVDVL